MKKVYYKQPLIQTEFLAKVLNINENSFGLDIGSGAGFHLQELQKASDNVFGVDILELDYKNFIKADIFKNDLDFDNNLDFCYTLSPYFGNDWNNLEVLLEKLYKYLKSDGLFYLDLFDFNTLANGKVWRDYEILPKRIILSKFQKTQNSVTATRIIKFQDWSEKEFELYWRVFEKTELAEIASSNGFKLIQDYSNYDTNVRGVWREELKSSRLGVLFKKI